MAAKRLIFHEREVDGVTPPGHVRLHEARKQPRQAVGPGLRAGNADINVTAMITVPAGPRAEQKDFVARVIDLFEANFFCQCEVLFLKGRAGLGLFCRHDHGPNAIRHLAQSLVGNAFAAISGVRGEPVPEPTSIAFLATGGLAAGVVAAARRRRRRGAGS